MAVTANRAMQAPVQDGSGRTFLKTSQTTRHFMGYHQSNQMHIPAINVTERDLRDQFLPAYEAMQVDGIAWNGLPGGMTISLSSAHSLSRFLLFANCASFTDFRPVLLLTQAMHCARRPRGGHHV